MRVIILLDCLLLVEGEHSFIDRIDRLLHSQCRYSHTEYCSSLCHFFFPIPLDSLPNLLDWMNVSGRGDKYKYGIDWGRLRENSEILSIRQKA